jgi:hypothetical protein
MTRSLLIPLLCAAAALAATPARAADDGSELTGDWTSVTPGEGFTELWTIKKEKGEWSVRCSYVKDGKEVGSFQGKDCKYADGALTFTQDFVKKPVDSWDNGSQVAMRAAGDKLKFTWRNGLARGEGEVVRAKK